jgi:hypothetical protein
MWYLGGRKMKKIVKKLAEKAGIVNRKFAFGQYWEDDLTDEQKQFAKLIIEECANICHKMAEVSDSWVVHDGDTCAAQIKKHFGVKE